MAAEDDENVRVSELGSSFFDAATLSSLVEVGTWVRIRAGDWLFREGEFGDAMFVVESGRLEVLGSETEAGHRIRILSPGAVVGELALLCEAPRVASVRAMRDSILLVVSRDVFVQRLQSETGLAMELVHALAAKLRTRSSPLAQGSQSRAFAFVPVDAAGPALEVADGFGHVISAWGRVARLTPNVVTEDNAEWSARLDGLERDHEFVLLVGDSDWPSSGWNEFCTRQADLVLGVAGDVPRGAVPSWTAWDLVLCGKAAQMPARRSWAGGREHGSRHMLGELSWTADIEQLARRVTGRSVGIVLSGGGARGLAHLGVLEVLLDAGIQIDRVGGTSMGALIGGLFAAGHPPAEIARMCRVELVDRNPFRDFTVPRVALIRARRARAMLERLFGNTHFDDLCLECFCVSADLNLAEVVVHRHGPIVDAVGASMSLPGLAPPVRIGERLLVDGGVLNNVPVDVMVAAGEGPVVAVDVMVHGAVGRSRGRMPSMVETLARASVLGSHAQAEARLAAAYAVIAPDLGTVGLLEFSRCDEIIAAGRHAAQRAVDAGVLEELRTGSN